MNLFSGVKAINPQMVSFPSSVYQGWLQTYGRGLGHCKVDCVFIKD